MALWGGDLVAGQKQGVLGRESKRQRDGASWGILTKQVQEAKERSPMSCLWSIHIVVKES